MPRGGGDRRVAADCVGWLPGLEVGVDDVDLFLTCKAGPGHSGERFTQFDACHDEPAIDQWPRRDAGPRSDLQHVIARMKPAEADNGVEQRFGVARPGLVVQLGCDSVPGRLLPLAFGGFEFGEFFVEVGWCFDVDAGENAVEPVGNPPVAVAE
jgi:hypothetical protein